jgi:methionyl-tRNA synthetase
MNATAGILNTCLQLTCMAAEALAPFLPFTSEKILQALQVGHQPHGVAAQLPIDHHIGQLGILFSKITDEMVAAQVAKLESSKQVNEVSAAAPLKSNVSFESFQEMDIRVATILEAEKVAKTKKLLKLTVDTGVDTRTVVSGIAEHYNPEDVIGKQVLLLANLAPRDIKGITSQGMILMAEDSDGKLTLVSPVGEVKPGGLVK